jgi:hypothetical protein
MIELKKGEVFINGVLKGSYRDSCCKNVDFTPLKSKGTFVMLKVKGDKRKIKSRISQILTLSIPKKPFLWNFRKMNKSELEEYQKRLLEL